MKPAENRVVVGRKHEITSEQMIVDQLNWYCDPPDDEKSWKVKIRYNSPEIPCRVGGLENGKVRVLLDRPAVITPGQSAVFYMDDLVMGGGIICPPS